MGTLFDFEYMLRSFPQILKYAPVTLMVTVGAMVFGLIIGLATALVKLYRVPVLRWIAAVYVSFTRGTPLLVQIYLTYYGIPKLMAFMGNRFLWTVNVGDIPTIVYVYVAFSLNVGAYLSESVRSAIESVDKGQYEAAYSVGMGRLQTMFRIILPQAFAVALPNFGNTFISLMKDTSLAFVIAFVEIMGQAKIVGARSLRFFEVYIDSALIYWGMCLAAERGIALLEKKAKKFKGG
ncbi:MAG: amino acid ABC transporter permease [Candidatus Scatomorpha sp.]|jgi:His/Glu/Gln/Arg/opine family amino acid ABC transporter permease subunit